MPRSKKEPPRFLTKALSSNKLAHVRKKYTPWLTTAKKKWGEELQMSMEVLLHFIEYLGKEDRNFRGISKA